MVKFLKKIKELIISVDLYLRLSISKKKKRFFIFDIPLYANLGDQAIIEAEKKFLKDNFPKTKIIEISSYLLDRTFLFNIIKSNIKPSDILFTTGGGSLDDRAYRVVERFNLIISSFKNNKIIMFPQTIDFSKTEKGKKLFKEMINICSEHHNLVIAAREKYSFEIMKKHFLKNEIILVPDIVLYLSVNTGSIRKNEALVVLRHDQEKKINAQEENLIYQYLEKINSSYKKIDTVLMKNGKKRKMYRFNRKFYLRKMFFVFSNSKIVITDRLHGMIFATITNTPAIVLSNSNHKVKGVYEWIKHHNYIAYIDNVNDFILTYNKLLEEKVDNYDLNQIQQQFQPLVNIVRKEVN